MAKTLRKRKVAKAYGVKVKAMKLKTGVIKDIHGNYAYRMVQKSLWGYKLAHYAFCDSKRADWQNERIFKRELEHFVRLKNVIQRYN